MAVGRGLLLSVRPVLAETIWDRFSSIMQDIYGQVVAISTIVAVTVAAIALGWNYFKLLLGDMVKLRNAVETRFPVSFGGRAGAAPPKTAT